MKIFVVLVTVCVVGAYSMELSEDELKIINRHKKECIKKTGLSEEEYDKQLEEKVYHFNDKMNCFTACMFKRMGIMGHDGMLEEDIVRALVGDRLPAEVLEAGITNCKNESGKDHCEMAGKISLCFMKNGATL